jgi:type VI secretion system secreted protein Hcp
LRYQGESTDKDHKDWVSIMGYHESVTHFSVAPKTGASSTAPVHSEFSVTKLLDAATPKHYEACATGKHIKEVTIELASAKGGSPYLQIKLEDVAITSVADSSDPAVPVQFPLESVSLAYGEIEFTYTKQNPDGAAAENVVAKWNVSQGAA